MPKPRFTQLSPQATPFYHCVSRCVRRAFLCGIDPYTGASYDHRREWIEAKIIQLTSVFAIKLCAYSVMSNHVHMVLFINKPEIDKWDDTQIIKQWHLLFVGMPVEHRFLRGELSDSERVAIASRIDIYRERLQNVSWFIRCLKEEIARKANKEDGCTGRFWEGRFKSQALLDDQALLACMAYVDLNPVRAKMARSPESSAFTSISARIRHVQENSSGDQPQHLMPFTGNAHNDQTTCIPCSIVDYVALVDWTGRIVKTGKRGAIPADTPPMLERLALNPQQWQELAHNFEARLGQFIGSQAATRQHCEQLGYQRVPGIKNNTRFLN